MTGLLIALLLVAGHFHWGAGLLGFSIWLPWQILKRGRIGIVPGWQGWGIALTALILSTALSERPSGLAWVGLLQWLSLGGGILALQAVFREQPEWTARSWWVLLGTGVFDAFRWSLDLYHAHYEWWAVRVDGLPLFPFRIRLFGSHGSTQAAAWLGLLVLVGAIWAYPRLRSIWAKALGLGVLLWWSMLMGMCDSRLALGALCVVVVLALWRDGFRLRLFVLPIVPAALWAVRDLSHPSRMLTGGSNSGSIFVLAAILAIACSLAARRILPRFRFSDWMRAIAGWGALSIPAVPVIALMLSEGGQLNHWSTGRYDFWGAALDALRENPILGLGPWGYVWEYSQHHLWGYAFLAMHPHNALLEVAVAGGLVLIAGCLWIIWACVKWERWNWARSKDVLVGGLFLALSMSFDSPMSSPQIQMAIIVLAALALFRVPEPRWIAPPRSLALLPLLFLVPLAFIMEAQIGKSELPVAGQMIRGGRWEDGAKVILDASKRSTPDPQWLRNTLMARTALHGNSPDTLRVLRPLWDSLLRLEPSFHPNRVHLAWVDWRLSPSPRNDSAFQSSLEVLWAIDQPAPPINPVLHRWQGVYPNDSLAYWLREAVQARSKGDVGRSRWVGLWLEQRITPNGLANRAMWRVLGQLATVSIRPAVEEQIYGSVGTGWLLIPEIEAGL